MAGWKQCAFGLALGMALAAPAIAADDTIKIGILNDQVELHVIPLLEEANKSAPCE